MINHSGPDHGVGRIANDLVGDVVLPDVPAIPAHVRRQGEGLAADDLERAAGRAVCIGNLEKHVVSSGLREPAAQLTGLGVDHQSLGQSFHTVMERTFSGGRDLEQERRAGPDAEDLGSVDPRLWARLGREHHRIGRPGPGRAPRQ